MLCGLLPPILSWMFSSGIVKRAIAILVLVVTGAMAVWWPRPRLSNFSLDTPPELDAFFNRVASMPAVDPVFTLQGGRLLFSAREAGRYQIRSQEGILSGQTARWDHFYPVLFGGHLVSLFDRDGDQKNEIEGETGCDLSRVKWPARLYSGLLVARAADPASDEVYVIRPGDNRCLRGPFPLSGRYTGHAFSADGKLLAVTSTLDLRLIDLTGAVARSLAEKLPGEKTGPVFDSRGALYFAGIGSSGFRDIFVLTPTADETPKLVDASPHDKSQLAISGSSLYFIEDVTTEYLLTRYDLVTHQLTRITREGVVYRYQLDGVRAIVSYADLNHPLSLYELNLETARRAPLYPKNLPEIELEPALSEQPPGLSQAWRFPVKGSPRGIVLSVHGGPDINVSPRWEPLFELWNRMGYEVIAPNYPGSRGFGEKFLEASLPESLVDLSGWLEWIQHAHPGLPIYLEGMSYGGILAQYLWSRHPADFRGVMLRSSHLARRPDEFNRSAAVLVELGRHDALVPYGESRRVLASWMKGSHTPIFFREYPHEGHVVRGSASLVDSLRAVATFMSRH